MEKWTEEELLNGRMEAYTKANTNKIKNRALESILIKTEKHMKEDGRMATDKEKEFLLINWGNL